MKNLKKPKIRNILSESECIEANKFIDVHYKSCDKFKFSIHLTATGIGQCVEIKCKTCKEKVDITDYESW